MDSFDDDFSDPLVAELMGSQPIPSVQASTDENAITARIYRSRWYKLGLWIVRFKYPILLLATLASVPCAYYGANLKRDLRLTSFAPRNAESTKTYLDINAKVFLCLISLGFNPRGWVGFSPQFFFRIFSLAPLHCLNIVSFPTLWMVLRRPSSLIYTLPW